MNAEIKAMRDVLIEKIYERMAEDKKVFFLSADFGSPKLDNLRKNFKDRFINVGIAEQNLVNTAAGLALEGFTVFCYAIAPFLTMRAYEQIRNNLSLLSYNKDLNVNLIGVGAGLSYDVSGPTHHCLEDLTIMRALPNMVVFSPSDWRLAERFLDYAFQTPKPKYIRLDGKPLARIYQEDLPLKFEQGFCELREGKEVCLVTTGYMTHTALAAAEELAKQDIKVGVIDVFLLKPLEESLLYASLSKYQRIISLEEAFIGKGGLDGLLSSLLNSNSSQVRLERMGFEDQYVFEVGGREYLHKKCGLDQASLIAKVKK